MNNSTIAPGSVIPSICGELLFAGDLGDEPVNVGAAGGELSWRYKRGVEQDEEFPAVSTAIAVITVVTLAKTLIGVSKSPVPSINNVNAGGSMHAPTVYNFTVDPGSALPWSIGVRLFAGEEGVVPRRRGADGAPLSVTYTSPVEHNETLAAPSVAVAVMVVDEFGGRVTTALKFPSASAAVVRFGDPAQEPFV